jgi:FkbM family methyltransferase
MKSLNLLIFIKNFIKFIIMYLNINFFIKKKIGKTGIFYFHFLFFFSDFNKWAISKKNNGFEKLISYSRKSSCILDIGSHIGLVALPLSASLNGYIHCFEPSISNFNLLKLHIKKNKSINIVANNFFVSSQNKSFEFNDNLVSSPNNSILNSKNLFFTKKKNISMITIDKYVTLKSLKPDLIKIDVEGHEYDVLLGAMETIYKYKPLIVLSYHPKLVEKNGQNDKVFLALLSRLNLTIKTIDGRKLVDLFHTDYLLSSN